MKALIVLIGLLMMAPVYAEQSMFDIVVQDTDRVKEIRSEGDNIWIKLTPAYLADEITVRISNQANDFYRPWFNGSVDLVSKGFRGNDVWTDRVQTEANFIEYWHDGTLILHLKRK